MFRVSFIRGAVRKGRFFLLEFQPRKIAPYEPRIRAISIDWPFMPPRSFYLAPEKDVYLRILQEHFPEGYEEGVSFVAETGLPPMPSFDAMALYLGIEASLLRQLLHAPHYHYRRFSIRKRDGSERIINAPKTYMKVIQWWILDNILEKVPVHSSVHGFRRGRSYITNAVSHLGQAHILNVDIEDFFPTIERRRVVQIFRGLGYSDEVAGNVANLLTLEGVLPQGSPCSPMLANLVFHSADEDIQRLCDGIGAKYTRYADDITVSSGEFISEEFLREIKRVVFVNGFRLNERKTRFCGKGDRMEVTGLVVNGGVRLPREWRYRAKAIFHQVLLNPKKFEARVDEVRGLYGAMKAVDPNSEDRITIAGLHAVNALDTLDI